MSIRLTEIKGVIEFILFILKQRKGRMLVDSLHEILYAAEKRHLLLWADTIFEEPFSATKDGPRLEILMKVMNHKEKDPEIEKMFHEALAFSRGFVMAQREPDMGYLSVAEKEDAIDALRTYEQKSPKDSAWMKAYKTACDMRIDFWRISTIEMARAAGCEKGSLEYIKENISLKKWLKGKESEQEP